MGASLPEFHQTSVELMLPFRKTGGLARRRTGLGWSEGAEPAAKVVPERDGGLGGGAYQSEECVAAVAFIGAA